jgi:hypothetical protein
MMHNLEESDPILHSISSEIHRLILKPDPFSELGFTDEISREELSEYYRVILEKMPYLDNEFVINELTYYLK